MHTLRDHAATLTAFYRSNHERYVNGDIGPVEYAEDKAELKAKITAVNNEITGGFAMKEAHEKGMVR